MISFIIFLVVANAISLTLVINGIFNKRMAKRLAMRNVEDAIFYILASFLPFLNCMIIWQVLVFNIDIRGLLFKIDKFLERRLH